MKLVEGVWLPQSEEHLVGLLRSSRKVDGKGTYQYEKLMAAMRHVPTSRRRLALDIGAHVGLWSMHLVKMFREVIAFEPASAHLDCLHRNVSGNNFGVYPCALGDRASSVSLALESGSSGGTHIDKGAQGTIPMLMLDDFELDEVDFIKIDVEGYEKFVVRGGAWLIRKCKPTIILEQKPKGLAERYGAGRFDAFNMLKSWDAELKFEMSGDFCFAWPT